MTSVMQVDPTAHATKQANLCVCAEGSVLVVVPLIQETREKKPYTAQHLALHEASTNTLAKQILIF